MATQGSRALNDVTRRLLRSGKVPPHLWGRAYARYQAEPARGNPRRITSPHDLWALLVAYRGLFNALGHLNSIEAGHWSGNVYNGVDKALRPIRDALVPFLAPTPDRRGGKGASEAFQNSLYDNFGGGDLPMNALLSYLRPEVQRALAGHGRYNRQPLFARPVRKQARG